jgi:pyoverdine/dityrosine biosynthesis protein Dit1
MDKLLDNINLTDVEKCRFIEQNDKYYLIATSTYFFTYMRLGD